MKIDLRLGDCIEVLKTIPDNSIDSIVTDPPYGLGFMGKEWDTFDKSQFGNIPDECSDENVYNKKGFNTLPRYKTDGLYQFAYDWATECLRVLKPGGHLLSFAGSRTYHKICIGIEDAGFEIRDQIMWVYGSGFPKSLNIGKAIDKKEGNEREYIGEKNDGRKTKNRGWKKNYVGEYGTGAQQYTQITKGNSEWEGWGTALKPSHEPIVLARKPLSEKSIAENVLKHGTGGINIDGSRIGYVSDYDKKHQEDIRKGTGTFFGGKSESKCEQVDMEGRFPANIIFDEEAGKLLDEQSGISKSKKRPISKEIKNEYHQVAYGKRGDIETIRGHNDSGGASRFFYCPKTSKKDRGENNNHPTVKPTDLMRYLINLVTPKGGTTLDPFMGSGSTGKAAVRCGVNFIGIEKEQEYMKIAEARINHERNKTKQLNLFNGEI